MGFVLGPLLEEHFRRAMVFSNGDLGIFVRDPISAGLLLATLAVLILASRPAIRRRRGEIFVEEDA